MFKLQAVDLCKSYRGRKVVDALDLEVGQGEVVGLLGPNGAGKTTTFYILVGLARPDSGRVLLDGDDITDLPMYLRARSGISYLPQEPSVFRQLTVEENLLRSSGDSSAEAGAAAGPVGGVAGTDGTRNSKNESGLHTVRRRAPPLGNCAFPGAEPGLHASGRAFFGNRPTDRAWTFRRSSRT